jgi:formyltetrahydrofolate-dependent phosphoribosylglycinamide formyltransferase
MKRLVVMISGGGTNLQAIIDAIAAKELEVQIVLVVSNKADAYGLTRAQNANIPTLVFPLKPYKELGREAYDTALTEQVAQVQPDLIVLAGWMQILTPKFIDPFIGRIINLHPALPGAFPGKDAIQRTFEAYRSGDVPHGGVMIHHVIPEVDAGEVVLQEVVPIEEDDTLEMFERRMHQVEHRLIVASIKKLIEG